MRTEEILLDQAKYFIPDAAKTVYFIKNFLLRHFLDKKKKSVFNFYLTKKYIKCYAFCYSEKERKEKKNCAISEIWRCINK